MSIIYLDQWVYVELLRTEKHLPPQYPRYASIYTGLLETSRKGTNQFPFSVAHVYETMKRTDLNSRRGLFRLIFELSQFCAIRPWDQVVSLEVRNAILNSLAFQPIDLSDFVFGNEFAHCFGSKAVVTSNESNKEVPQEIRDELQSALKDPELVSDLLSRDQDRDWLRQAVKQDESLANVLEDLRKPKYLHPDKTMRENMEQAACISEIIEPRFTRMFSELKSDLQLDLDLEDYRHEVFSSKESAQTFVKSVPTAYVYSVLTDARNRNVGRPIEPNDLMDIGPLAIAVPYCDVVVTEREWSNILNERKIGELYNTKITHKIEDLTDFIE
jgi:hypothetical protein